MGRAGFEQSALKASKTPISGSPRTESGTVKDDQGRNEQVEHSTDPGNTIASLAHLLATLPESDRAELIADMPLDRRRQVARVMAKRIMEGDSDE